MPAKRAFANMAEEPGVKVSPPSKRKNEKLVSTAASSSDEEGYSCSTDVSKIASNKIGFAKPELIKKKKKKKATKDKVQTVETVETVEGKARSGENGWFVDAAVKQYGQAVEEIHRALFEDETINPQRILNAYGQFMPLFVKMTTRIGCLEEEVLRLKAINLKKPKAQVAQAAQIAVSYADCVTSSGKTAEAAVSPRPPQIATKKVPESWSLVVRRKKDGADVVKELKKTLGPNHL